jgi:S-layer homology domain
MKRFPVCAAILLSGVAAVHAQDISGTRDLLLNPGPTAGATSPRPAPSYGTTQESLQRISMQSFSPVSSVMGYSYTDGSTFFQRYSTAVAPAGFVATPTLPSGALVIGVDFDVCDTDGVGDITLLLLSTDALGQNLQHLNSASTSGTPGCVAVFVPLASPYEIQNGTGQLLLDIVLHATNTTETFAGATVHYKLQVSPAPASATFADVPTSHPFFQYVEAFAATGITGGCGSGNYCPDKPVTRGQLAVFLAKALGLQFP